MITNLKIKNFKPHKETSLRLSGLTVLTGINGSGKTSFIQALLLLRQTFQKGRLMDGLDLNKPLCSVGIGNDALYRYASEGVIVFEWQTENGEIFKMKFNSDENALNDSFLNKLEYSENVSPERLANEALFNNHFQYISANRWGGVSVFPKETYAAETQKQLSLEYGQGELVAQFLYKFGSDTVLDYTGSTEEDLSLLNQTLYWERKISPQVLLHVESGKDSNSYAISYGYSAGEQLRPIQNLKAENVGYGISYTLPVVVALLSAEPGSLLIIENPEAHLHPAGQAELAKLMVLAVRNGVQVMVETHSDHIISGIQLACKEYGKNDDKGISKDQVSLYYFSNDVNHDLVIENIGIEDNGRLKYQPKGFFDQAEIDMFQLYDD